MPGLASQYQVMKTTHFERGNSSVNCSCIQMWHTLYNQVGPQDSSRANAHTGLSSSVGSTEASEDNCDDAAHSPKEWLEVSKLATWIKAASLDIAKDKGHELWLMLGSSCLKDTEGRANSRHIQDWEKIQWVWIRCMTLEMQRDRLQWMRLDEMRGVHELCLPELRNHFADWFGYLSYWPLEVEI